MRTPLISNAARGAAADDAPGQQVGGIVERISSAISLGMLAVGERLPAEVELAGQFGVAVRDGRTGKYNLYADVLSSK